jgi:hypothetical protein
MFVKDKLGRGCMRSLQLRQALTKDGHLTLFLSGTGHDFRFCRLRSTTTSSCAMGSRAITFTEEGVCLLETLGKPANKYWMFPVPGNFIEETISRYPISGPRYPSRKTGLPDIRFSNFIFASVMKERVGNKNQRTSWLWSCFERQSMGVEFGGQWRRKRSMPISLARRNLHLQIESVSRANLVCE